MLGMWEMSIIVEPVNRAWDFETLPRTAWLLEWNLRQWFNGTSMDRETRLEEAKALDRLFASPSCRAAVLFHGLGYVPCPVMDESELGLCSVHRPTLLMRYGESPHPVEPEDGWIRWEDVPLDRRDMTET